MLGLGLLNERVGMSVGKRHETKVSLENFYIWINNQQRSVEMLRKNDIDLTVEVAPVPPRAD